MPPARPILERWVEKVRPTDPHLCWEWMAGVNNHGYGKLSGEAPSRKQIYAHRFAWLTFRGTIPDETPFVLHHCDNPRCCNPWHLWLGTHADNMADMAAKGRSAHQGGLTGVAAYQRAKTHCKFGHEYTEENTYVRTRAGGLHQRECRACMRIRDAGRRPR